MVGLHWDFWGFNRFLFLAGNSLFMVSALHLVLYATFQYQIQAAAGSCKKISSIYQHCVIRPDGVRDLDCFVKPSRAGYLDCVWTPGGPKSHNNYTLTVQQKQRYCKVHWGVTGPDTAGSNTGGHIGVFKDHNVTVEVFETGDAKNCTRAVFKGSPKDLQRCGPPRPTSLRRHSGGLQVNVSWPDEDGKAVQNYTARYKVPGEPSWTQSLVGSQNRSSCRVEDLNPSLVYVVQLRCVPNNNCFQCPWSGDHLVQPELTSQPVILDLQETKVEGEESRRLVVVTWKRPDGESNEGYDVRVRKASGETSGKEFRTSEPRVRLILSYSAYLLSVTAVNNVSDSPAASCLIRRREDSPGASDGRLRVAARDNTTLAVFWRDDLVKTFVCFSVEWQEKGGKMWHRSFHEDVGNNWTLSPLPEPLKPHRRYSITLHTRTNRETCNMVQVNGSESTYGTTHFYFEEASPLSAPTNISISDVSLRSATLRWSRIPEDDLRGFLRGYTVAYTEYHQRGASPENQVTVDPTLNSFQLEDLRGDTVYQVEIFGFTAAGAGPRSTASFFKTNPTGRFDQKGFIAVFAAVAVMLIVTSPIIKRVKTAVWPKIPNPGYSDALQKIDSVYELDLQEAAAALQVEEWDTKSLLVLEREVLSPANVQPAALPQLDASDHLEESPERSWTSEDADDTTADVVPERNRQPAELQTPFPFTSGYTTMEMFQRSLVLNTDVTPAAEGKLEDPEWTGGAKPGASYVRRYDTNLTSDCEDVCTSL